MTQQSGTSVSNAVASDRMVQNGSEDESNDEHAGSYTIDDLAAATGVPSRTIRFYQARGALPPPRRRGRVAYYDDRHIERLKLVAHLQDRGLNLRAIRDLFERTEGGDVSVAEWLGVGDRLRAPWTDDRPRVVNESELRELLGPEPRPGLIAELTRAGLLRRGEGTNARSYFVPSQGLLSLALRLDAAGVGIDVAREGHEILRRRLSRAADELAEYFVKEVGDKNPEEVTTALEALRAAGVEAVRLVFAQEMERALGEMVEQGRAMPRRRRRRRGS